MGVPNFRFSLAWSRILPQGTGEVNHKGIEFYNNLIDACLERQITPWITLYHWDLPFALEQEGGWTNRKIIDWFSEYVKTCLHHFGDRVNHWMVMNEPTVFTGAGYLLGVHAPGKRWFNNFLPAFHHAVLAQAEGIRTIKAMQPRAEAGISVAATPIHPYQNKPNHQRSAGKVDALINRSTVEPALGLGYPVDTLPFLKKIYKYFQSGDEEKLACNFDYLGIQNYTRAVIRYNPFIPYLQAWPVQPQDSLQSAMNWEIYPNALFEALQQFNQYEGIPNMIVTENGLAMNEAPDKKELDDQQRQMFIRESVQQIYQAQQKGIPVKGYFIWSLTDNLEWREGYDPRFGLVYVDYATQKRLVKNSGYWYRAFLTNNSLQQGSYLHS